jgi:hypothetical protein
MMRLPLEIAMEVGSFLDQPSLTVCTTQLCWNGVGFVSSPCTDSAKVTTIKLHELAPLCRTVTEAPMVDQEQNNGLATEAIKRIDLCLARRTSAEKVVFAFYFTETRAYASMDVYYSEIHRHFQVSANLQFENGRSLAVEWHAHAEVLTSLKCLLGETTGARLDNGRPLALWQSLHALDLNDTEVNDISALASCQSLHTLLLNGTEVKDVSALASCQALHTLDLSQTQVHDISALASCQNLQALYLSDTPVSDISALASCQALHTLLLTSTRVNDVSALASCQALHTLGLVFTRVSDVSALAACQSLHTLDLTWAPVGDVSALVACGSLRCVYGCQQKRGYEAIARLLVDRM